MENNYSDYAVIYLYLETYSINYVNKKCNFYQRLYTIGDDDPSLTVNFNNIFGYDWVPIDNQDLGIEIECERASKLLVENNDGTTYEILNGTDGRFFVQAKKAIDAKTFTPICDDESEKFCIIRKNDIQASSLYLAEYESSEGVTEENNYLGGGFKKEIFHGSLSLTFTKNWDGLINFVPLVQRSASLTYNRE